MGLRERCKLPSGGGSPATNTKLKSNHHHQDINTRVFTGRMPALLVVQHTGRSTEGFEHTDQSTGNDAPKSDGEPA